MTHRPPSRRTSRGLAVTLLILVALIGSAAAVSGGAALLWFVVPLFYRSGGRAR